MTEILMDKKKKDQTLCLSTSYPQIYFKCNSTERKDFKKLVQKKKSWTVWWMWAPKQEVWGLTMSTVTLAHRSQLPRETEKSTYWWSQQTRWKPSVAVGGFSILFSVFRKTRTQRLKGGHRKLSHHHKLCGSDWPLQRIQPMVAEYIIFKVISNIHQRRPYPGSRNKP